MSKHTPGPWTVEATPPDDRSLSIVSQTAAVTVAYVPCLVDPARFGGSPAYVDQQYADAALIAAAPGMLAALRALLASAEAVHSFGLGSNVPPLTAVRFCDTQSNARAVIARAEGVKQ